MGNTDSKPAMRQQFGRLLTEHVQLDDSQYWNVLLGCNGSDFFELITPDDVRTLRDHRPLNACNFFKRLIHEFQSVILDGVNNKLTSEGSARAITCIRLLTRVMPFILEDYDYNEVVQTLFWRPGGYVPRVQQEFKNQLSKDFGHSEIVPGGDDGSQDDNSIIIGAELLICLMRLLFLKGFTVSAAGVVIPDDEPLPKHKVDARFLWKGGVGTAKSLAVPTTTFMIKNRTEILRCLLICLSGSLYQTIDEYQQHIPTWLRVFAGGDLPYTANLFCSLMSTIFTFDPVGYGVPYGSLFSSADGEELVSASLQLLITVMDVNPEVFSQDAQGVSSEDPPHSRMSQTAVDPRNGSRKEESGQDRKDQDEQLVVRNVYRTMLSGLKKEAEIELVFQGFANLLSTCPNSQNSFLPNSAQQISFHQELLILLWHLTTTNPVFLRRVSSKLNSSKLVVPLLFLLLDSSNSRQDSSTGPSKVGLLHMCSFILLVFSSEREFAVKLNEPFNDKFPLDLPIFHGCYADLVALVIHRVIVDSAGSSSNDSLIDMLLTVLCNISAYIKSFTFESCVKLLHLLEKFSRPAWLLKAPYHYHDVFFLLDMFNNLIQYQYEGNQRLVYSILRQKHLILELQNLQLPQKSSPEIPAGNGHSPAEEIANIEVPTTDTSDGGNSEWVPTAEWFNVWKSKLPLQTITRLIQCLLPLVETECQEKGLVDQSEVLEYLQRTTMVGLLPVPHPIIIRNYQPNAYTALWFTSYMWGVIFSRSQNLGLFDWRKIKLILINNQ